jgi:hypothetical protein
LDSLDEAGLDLPADVAVADHGCMVPAGKEKQS